MLFASPNMAGQYKVIKGTAGRYAVSRDGQVMSLKRLFVLSDRLLRQRKDKDGYQTVLFCLESGQKTRKVHRLVAEAFIRNPKRKKTVNHKSGIKTDNSVSNLEWATIQENAEHSWRTLGRKPHENQRAAASKLWRGSGNPKWKDGRRMKTSSRLVV